MDIVLLILLILVLLALVFLYGKWQSLALLLQDQAEDTADNLSDQLGYQLENATLKQQQAIHQEVERLRPPHAKMQTLKVVSKMAFNFGNQY